MSLEPELCMRNYLLTEEMQNHLYINYVKDTNCTF